MEKYEEDRNLLKDAFWGEKWDDQVYPLHGLSLQPVIEVDSP
jgi:hypothetical protein